jgi:taurine dioxygenase
MTFERVTGTVGAIVHGLDLDNLSPEQTAGPTLRQALAEHGVLFLHADGPVGSDAFRSLAYLFGETFAYPYGDRPVEHPDISDIDFEESGEAVETRTNHWHTDGTPQTTPPYAALLTPTVLPSFGGDTMWASVTAAFDALSSRTQRLLDGMEALHSTAAVARHFPSDLAQKYFGEGESAVHPVVPTDPVTGRKFLYVNANYTERLLGMSEWESTRLIQMLVDHINTPEFHVRLRWQIGTIAVWHERVTQHRAVADYNERRVLRRMTILGEALTQ